MSSTERSGGMATSPVDSWAPTFPVPDPAHWVAFVSRTGRCEVLSDQPLGREECTQLARWLDRYSPREQDTQASYVYLGLAYDWPPLVPDGRTSQGGVSGVGSGIGLGEPEGAVASTLVRVLASAIDALDPGEDSDRDPDEGGGPSTTQVAWRSST